MRDRPDSFTSASAVVRVVPLWGEGAKDRASVPVTMTVQTAGDEVGASGQLGFAGTMPFLSGALDVDVLSGSRSRTPLFGTRDRYRISYTTQNLSLRLLDHFQALSPLTTNGQFGTGIGGEYRGGQFRIRGTAQTTRHMFPQRAVFGTSFGYSWNAKSITSYNLMHRTGLYEGTVATLRHEQTLAGGAGKIDMECGMDSRGGVGSPSCQASASGTVGGLGFHSRLLSTSDSYPGSSADGLEAAARLKYRVSSRVAVEGAFLRRTYDLSAGFKRESSRYLFGAELSGPLGPGRAFAQARVVLEEQAYSTPGISIDREEDWLQWQAGYQVRPFGVTGSLDVGRARSRTNRYDGSALRSRITARAQPLETLSVWATAEYATGYLVNANTEMQRWLLSLRTNLTLGKTEVSATVYHSQIRTVATQRSTSFKSLVRHSLTSGRQISFQVQHTVLAGFGNTVGTDYRLAYAQPLGLPLGARPAAESFVEGRIYDADSGLGLANVLLFLGGSAAISGDDGAFRLPASPGSTNYLRVDQKSVGYGRVSLVPLPMEITTNQERTNLLDIPVRLAAELKGSVDLYGSSTGLPMLGQPQVQLRRLTGLGGLILELRSPVARYRTRTATDGSFSFEGVVPETYQLEIVSNLPHRHHVETDRILIELGPGQKFAKTLRVVPTRPAIQMMETATSATLSVPSSPAAPQATLETASATAAKSKDSTADAPVNPPESLRLDWDLAASRRLYTLVIGSTPEEEIAHMVKARYEHLGLRSTVLVEEIDTVNWFRVVVGQFRSAEDSNLFRQAGASDLPPDSWVLRLGIVR